jgi:hypothetical protein
VESEVRFLPVVNTALKKNTNRNSHDLEKIKEIRTIVSHHQGKTRRRRQDSRWAMNSFSDDGGRVAKKKGRGSGSGGTAVSTRAVKVVAVAAGAPQFRQPKGKKLKHLTRAGRLNKGRIAVILGSFTAWAMNMGAGLTIVKSIRTL